MISRVIAILCILLIFAMMAWGSGLEQYFIRVSNTLILKMYVHEKAGYIWRVHIMHEPYPIYIDVRNYFIYDKDGNQIF